MLRRGAVLEPRRTATDGSMCVFAVGASRLCIVARCAMLNGGANCAPLRLCANYALTRALGQDCITEKLPSAVIVVSGAAKTVEPFFMSMRSSPQLKLPSPSIM